VSVTGERSGWGVTVAQRRRDAALWAERVTSKEDSRQKNRDIERGWKGEVGENALPTIAGQARSTARITPASPARVSGSSPPKFP
jgi:hypothetical protein